MPISPYVKLRIIEACNKRELIYDYASSLMTGVGTDKLIYFRSKSGNIKPKSPTNKVKSGA